MIDWRDVVGFAAMGFGACGILVLAFAMWWVWRQPEEQLERRLSSMFLRRRSNGERRKLPQPEVYTPEQAGWYVRGGDRRHGAGRRQGH